MVLLKLDPNDLKTKAGSGKIIFTRKNIEKLDEFPKGPLIELIQGDIYLVPSPTPLHQEISANLNFAIKKYLVSHPVQSQPGKLYYAPIDLILSEENLVIPDLVFIKKSNESIIKEKAIEGIPNLVIEILSTNREHDLHYKKDLYESFGIQEYWIVDPVSKSIEIFNYSKEDLKYLPARVFKSKDAIISKVLYNFTLNVDDIFPE